MYSLFVLDIPSRPRKLKVVINPRSKKGQARLVYIKHVAPLFEKAGIRADVMSELILESALTFRVLLIILSEL